VSFISSRNASVAAFFAAVSRRIEAVERSSAFTDLRLWFIMAVDVYS